MRITLNTLYNGGSENMICDINIYECNRTFPPTNYDWKTSIHTKIVQHCTYIHHLDTSKVSFQEDKNGNALSLKHRL